MVNAIGTFKKSEKLLKADKIRLKTFVSKYDNYQEAARAIGVSRQTLHRVMSMGTAAGVTVIKIKAILL